MIISVTEADAGRYDCMIGGSLLCSYNVTVDAHRCTPPSKSNEYQKIYSDWCHEFEKYKSAMKVWERKQAVSFFFLSKQMFSFSLYVCVFLPFSFSLEKWVEKLKLFGDIFQFR